MSSHALDWRMKREGHKFKWEKIPFLKCFYVLSPKNTRFLDTPLIARIEVQIEFVLLRALKILSKYVFFFKKLFSFYLRE